MATAWRATASQTTPHDDVQAEVIAFLASGTAFGVGPQCVTLRTTHCAAVFLVGDRAWKLKRAIHFVGVDYRTIRGRERACQAEIALNRRTAPDIYLGVTAITREADGTLALDGKGRPCDWLVKMRRFDEDSLFDRLTGAGRLTPALAGSLGEVVAWFHARMPATPGHGSVAHVAHVIALDHAMQRRHLDVLPAAAVDALYAASTASLSRLAPQLEARRASGFGRHGHGDLRLANICLWHGAPTLFDCIDFSDAIACTDVLHDLAYLLMDLMQHGRNDLAVLVLEHYLAQLPQPFGARVLPLFLSMRGAMRSYTHANAMPRQTSAAAVEARRLAALADLAFAEAALAEPPPPALARLLACFGEPR